MATSPISAMMGGACQERGIDGGGEGREAMRDPFGVKNRQGPIELKGGTKDSLDHYTTDGRCCISRSPQTIDSK